MVQARERITVNLSAPAARALAKAAEREERSITEVTNRGVILYDYISEVSMAGGEVTVREPGGEPRSLKLL